MRERLGRGAVGTASREQRCFRDEARRWPSVAACSWRRRPFVTSAVTAGTVAAKCWRVLR